MTAARSATLAAVVIALMGCARAGISIPQSPLLKYVERKSGLIASAGTDGNLTIMDQAGGGVRSLTTDGQAQPEGDTGGAAPFTYYQLPEWSPDGSRLASVRVSGTGQSMEDVRITVIPVTKGQPVTVFSSTSLVPALVAWSPDSSLLVFLASSPGGASYGFYLVRASGGEPVLLDAGVPYGWAWSPRSRELVIHAGSASGGLASDRLAFLDVEADVLEEGLGIVAGIFDTPAWSPDGRIVLVASWEQGKNRLYLTNRTGTEGAVLAETGGALAFALSPRGDRVAYLAATGDATSPGAGLYMVNVPGRLGAGTKGAQGTAAKALSGADLVAGFFWSPDGARIAYFVPSLVDLPLEAAAAKDSQGKAAAPQQVVVLTLKVAEPGKGFAREVSSFIPTPGFLGTVQHFAQLGQTVRIWSPDSRQIVYSAIDDKGPGIMVAMAGESIAPRRIANGLDAYWSRR